ASLHLRRGRKPLRRERKNNQSALNGEGTVWSLFFSLGLLRVYGDPILGLVSFWMAGFRSSLDVVFNRGLYHARTRGLPLTAPPTRLPWSFCKNAWLD